jgi:hypothetical protein
MRLLPPQLRLVPIRFLLYQFSLLLFAACFTVVFGVDNDCQKRNLSGTDCLARDHMTGVLLTNADNVVFYKFEIWFAVRY